MIETFNMWLTALSARDVVWLCIGIGGQILFSARWIIQWMASEKSRRSTMPEVFWYLSFLGGLLVLSYGIHKMDPVIITGQFGVLVYARNLFFIRREKRPEQREAGVIPAE